MNSLPTSIGQAASKRRTGMFGFTIVWIGQIISLLGTSMTGFAIRIPPG
jgi:hypothetical protein